MNTVNNKRAKDSIAKIYNALCDLIQLYGHKSINIKRVCEHAKINRTTFYSHFDSVEDALYKFCEQYILRTYKIFLNTDLSYKERLILSLEIVKDKIHFFSYLFSNVNNLELRILEIISNNNIDVSNNISNEKSKLSLAFIISGIVGLYKTYLYKLKNNSLKEFSCRELAEIILCSINLNNPYFVTM